MESVQIRQQFLDFFAGKQHEIVESSPVVPHDDPTLLFTNAGMNQFKDVFLGTGSRKYNRAANTQKCIRAGGKHNDLDDVGQDTYHHTFFEMLGNWSFGDYFKKEAIEWAWELLTQVWGIDKDRLHATYFEGDTAEGLEPDKEAADLWRTVTDIDPSHIHPGNKKDNFWEMGDTGPCGPCSEIHVDLTPDKSGANLVNSGDARVIELWNLVFIQYNRGSDKTLTPLPAKHVDTGLGFERLCAVLQGTEQDRIGQVSNYDTDVFKPIFDAIQERTGAPAYASTLPGDDDPNRNELRRDRKEADERVGPVSNRSEISDRSKVSNEQIMVDVSYRVIADHVRCLTFALTDGAMPSNEGRGYVLRRILRRGVRYGRQYMNMHEPFMCDLVQPLIEHMSNAFPELRNSPAYGKKNVERVTELIRDEEASFFKTLERGIKLFNRAAMRAAYLALRKGTKIVGPLPEEGPSWVKVVDRENVFTGQPGQVFDEDVFTGDPDQLFDIDGHYFSVSSLTSNDVCSRLAHTPTISGAEAFKLHDTYGFPVDLTKLMAEESGLTIDIDEYDRLMESARHRARTASSSLSSFFQGGLRWAGSDDELQKYLGITEDCPKYLQERLETTLIALVELDEEGDLAFTFGGHLKVGQNGGLILKTTCFYGQQGGQVGDRGIITTSTGRFEVRDTLRFDNIIVHIGTVTSGKFVDERTKDQEKVTLQVNRSRRVTMQNHTATHLLNWALREVLEIEGEGKVDQKGSLVDPEKTRFDFSHNKPLTVEQLDRVEQLVNEKIKAKLPVYAASQEEDFVDQKEALKIETLRAIFGEKYPDRVRVVSIGAPIDDMLSDPKNDRWMQHSVEFCGGTHVKNTKEIERFVLTVEEGVAKGIRRVVGISGETAKQAIETGKQLLSKANALLTGNASALAGKPPVAPTLPSGKASALAGEPPVPPDQRRDHEGKESADQRRDRKGARSPDPLTSSFAALQQEVNDAIIPLCARRALQSVIDELQKLVKEQQKQSAAASSDAVMDCVRQLLESARTIGDTTVLVGEVPPAGTAALRGAVDWVRNKTKASAVFLATSRDDKVTLIAGMSKSVVAKGVRAGDLIKEIAPIVGGRGGGRPDMAQGGGSDPSAIPKAVERAAAWLADKLS